MEKTAWDYASYFLTALSVLLTYLNSSDRTKQLIHRGGFVLLMGFVTHIYARELYAMVQPGEPVNWLTILLGNGLMISLLTFAGSIPLALFLWRYEDRAKRGLNIEK